ncbi:MAG: substrate-binding domain-containing protein, partial [Bauldia sp.]|nr:substrate-binding domain-containing protein [Bauldia sp.]
MAAHSETVLVDMKGPGSGNPFWAAVEAGAVERGKELGVDVIILAPTEESDIQSQISQIEDQLTKGIDGMALAPTDPNALKPVVEQARKQGVGVVFIDTKGVNEGVTFIGTNNEVGAALAA